MSYRRCRFLIKHVLLCHQRWRNYSVSAKKRINSFVLLSTFRNFAASKYPDDLLKVNILQA